MDILPDELCQEIFSRLTGFDQCFDLVRPDLPAFRDATRAPFRIAATCTRWRALVLNSPELWAFLHARDDRPADDAYLRTCIEQSGQHPLDVWIHSDAEGWHGSPENNADDSDEANENFSRSKPPTVFFNWLDLLERNAHRWRRVRIDFPRPTPVEMFDPFTQLTPLLEQLVLSTPSTGFNEYLINTDRDSVVNPQQFCFQGGPKLRSLASHATLMVPVTVLSKLEYFNFSLRGLCDDTPLWDALAMTPALKELNLYYPSWYDFDKLRAPPPSSPLHLPALRCLGLLGHPLRDQGWNKYLSVPNLEQLTVSIEPMNNLGNLFASFSKTVRRVVITSVENIDRVGIFTRSDAVALENLQHIETLELRDITSSMIDGIGCFFDDPLPKWGRTLRKIILRNCTIYLSSCGSIATLVDMRRTAALEDVDDAFEFELVNTKLIQWADYQVPVSISTVMHLLKPSIVQMERCVEFELADYDHSGNLFDEDDQDDEPGEVTADVPPHHDGFVVGTSEVELLVSEQLAEVRLEESHRF
ncbi:hypothetical protein BKA62DRAFT_715762 [Auriculariales sp. MPI-PUGE-AT-0066]|nr:hypothetical protein BKA62DRAFT_715762 [Auriculariales sp. MPI-PUGE-AT-0066]